MDKYLLSINQLAEGIKISPSLARQLVTGKAKISIPVAYKLAKYLSNTPEYWYNLQVDYDFREAKKSPDIAVGLKAIGRAKKPTAKEIAAAKLAEDEKKARKTAREKKAVKPVKDSKTTKSVKPAKIVKAVKDSKPAKAAKIAALKKEVKDPLPKGRKSAAAKDVKAVAAKAPMPVEKKAESKKNGLKKTRPPQKPKTAATAVQNEETPDVPKKPHVILIKQEKNPPVTDENPVVENTSIAEDTPQENDSSPDTNSGSWF
jgi:addiction module HigA family antidote